MPNQKITDLQSLTATTAAPDDLTVVVDVTDLSSPTGNTKNMTLSELGKYLTSEQGLISSSAQVILNQTQGPLPVSSGGTGLTTLGTGVLVGNGTATASIATGSSGQILAAQGDSNPPIFIDGVVSSSVQINYPQISNIPTGIVSSSAQLTITSSGTFIGLTDTPPSYSANSLVVSNIDGTGLIFVTASQQGTPIGNQLLGGRSIANGTYYFNGDIRERIYSSIPVNNYTGSYSPFFQNFLHSGNIFYSPESQSIYFTRGSWPRRQGSSSADIKGYTWREVLALEGDDADDSVAEAICSTRDDGQNFTVILDLFAAPIFGSQANSTQDTASVHRVSEPSAVVYDKESNSIFFSCRNDHDNSCIYRIPASGSQQDMIDNGVLWVEMFSPNLKIDSLDIVTIPQNFYSVGSPATNTRTLLFGASPDYNESGNARTHKNAALYMVPTDVAPGQLQTDYPQAYVLHQFWGSSYDSSLPDMGKTGVKGIKTFIANVNGGEWNPDTDDISLVHKENSRIFVVSSGAISQDAITNPLEVQPDLSLTATLITPATSVPSNPAGSAPIPGLATPTAGNPFTGPAVAGPGTIAGVYNNVNFGGHSVLELLIGNVAGSSLTVDFSASDDANRQYKTWRTGILQQNGNTTVLNLGNDDPAQTVGTLASAPGAARGVGFTTNDRLFILTSPSQASNFNSQVPVGSLGCRGIVKIANVDCSNSNGTYTLSGGDGATALNTVMVIPILANTIDTDIQSMSQGGQQGLQQLTIDSINYKFYVADAFYSRYWATVMSSVVTPGRSTTIPFPSNPTPNPITPPAFNIPAVPGGSPVSYPPVPPVVISGTSGGNAIPGNVVQGNAIYNPGNPTAPTPGNPTGNPNPPYINPSTPNPNNPGTVHGYNPTNFNPANFNPNTYTSSMNPVLAGDPTGIPSITTTEYNAIISEFGTIYEGDLFVYSRNTNGQRIFDNANPQVAYSRPTGLTGYNVGPQGAFRLIYTNAENNFNLISNTLGFGVCINGLSRTFVQDGVLAQGRNIASISDSGPGVQGGIVITFDYPADTSDYALVAMTSNQQLLGTGQNHIGDPQTYTGVVDLSYPQNDGAYYYSKNRSQCRITYTSGSLPDVVHFACFEQ